MKHEVSVMVTTTKMVYLLVFLTLMQTAGVDEATSCSLSSSLVKNQDSLR